MSHLVHPLSGGVGTGGGGGITAAALDTAQDTTQGDIILRVTTGGSDTPTLTRPAKVVEGDHIAEPYLTIQAAINALPKIMRHPIIVSIGAGSFDGFVASSFHGESAVFTAHAQLHIAGTMALVTPTTGSASGTATSGTTTSITLAAAGWTVDDFRGKFLRLTAGDGAPTGTGTANDYAFVIAPIVSNTSDTITVTALAKTPFIAPTAITTPSATTVFEIVAPSTIVEKVNPALFPDQLDCIAFENCTSNRIHLDQMQIGETGNTTAVNVTDCESVTVIACKFTTASTTTNLVQHNGTNRATTNLNYFNQGSGNTGATYVQSRQVSHNNNVADSGSNGNCLVNDCSGRLFAGGNNQKDLATGFAFNDCSGSIRITSNTLTNFSGNGFTIQRCQNTPTNSGNVGTVNPAAGAVAGFRFLKGGNHAKGSTSTLTGVGAAGGHDLNIDGTTETHANLTAELVIVGAENTTVTT